MTPCCHHSSPNLAPTTPEGSSRTTICSVMRRQPTVPAALDILRAMTSQPPAGRPADRVRLGVAGLGAVAQAVHLPLIERLRDAYTIDAIADLSPTLTTAIGERYRVDQSRRVGTVEELVAASGLDAVAILTSGSHAPAVDDALDAGLPVFAEKPLAFTPPGDGRDRYPARDDGRSAPPPGLHEALRPGGHARASSSRRNGDTASPRAIEVTVLHPTGESQLAFAHLLPGPTDVPQAVRAQLTEATRCAPA